jgi:hypothetical protein
LLEVGDEPGLHRVPPQQLLGLRGRRVLQT